MSAQTLLTTSQVLVLIGIILTGLGGFGAYHFGNKVDDEKSKETVIPSTYNRSLQHREWRSKPEDCHSSHCLFALENSFQFDDIVQVLSPYTHYIAN